MRSSTKIELLTLLFASAIVTGCRGPAGPPPHPEERAASPCASAVEVRESMLQRWEASPSLMEKDGVEIYRGADAWALAGGEECAVLLQSKLGGRFNAVIGRNRDYLLAWSDRNCERLSGTKDLVTIESCRAEQRGACLVVKKLGGLPVPPRPEIGLPETPRHPCSSRL